MSAPRSFHRAALLDEIAATSQPWDFVVIGGGATGAGIALDAATRGYRVALFEQHDFGKGTSSRSTKLIHGGVRYLQQGNVALVRDALRERGRLIANAPSLVHRLPTIVPLYRAWEGPYYRVGLAAYDALAGRLGLGASRWLSRDETLAAAPTLRRIGLRGGVRYYDAAFDDTRLLIVLLQAAVARGAVCLNYVPVREVVHEAGRAAGVVVEDLESGGAYKIAAKVVVNATGPFSDSVRHLDDAGGEPMIAPSQGIHVVLPRRFLPGESAVIVPHTADGRVVFAIPWHGRTLVGTTDTLLTSAPLEPRPLPSEIEFLLETNADYLEPAPTTSDVLSVFAGVRPLVRRAGTSRTSKLGRDHVLHVEPSGMLSVLGGKWTTFRKMAEDAVDRAAELAGLPPVACTTSGLALENVQSKSGDQTGHGKLVAEFPYTTVDATRAARDEMARTVEDVLARRLRLLFLDASAAMDAAPRVASIMAAELGRDESWQANQVRAFESVASGYFVDRRGANST